jgi:hypothetical protein
MTIDDVMSVYERLDPGLKASMKKLIQSQIDKDDPTEISSSGFGRKVLKRSDADDWNRTCGAYSAQCFGILLKEFLADQSDWSSPEDMVGRKGKTYYRDPGW